MIGKVIHIGLTISNMEKSIEFYRDVLGLKFQGEMVMEGDSTDTLFNIKDCKVRVAYLNGSEEMSSPPIELLEFETGLKKDSSIELNNISISEVCFHVENIDKVYKNLLSKGVDFLSQPQSFDFTNQGFGKSKAVYFRDPDGIILELIEEVLD